MKDKKSLWVGIIIVVIVVFIGGFFGTKIYYLHKYNIVSVSDEEYFNYRDKLKVDNTINIKSKNLNENEYITFKNIKVRNDFENFEVLDSSDDQIRYVLNKNDKVEASFWYGITTDSLVYSLSNEFSLFGFEDENINLSVEERKEFFKDKNINNDIDLIKYLGTYEYKKNNLFTSTRKMKDNYFTKFITTFLIGGGNNITVIDGNYAGYIINMADTREAYIFKNNKKYVFTFINNDYFSDDYVEELLNTVVIGE